MDGVNESVLKQAKLVGVLLFCLVNPLAGWAYLATARARWHRQEAPLADTLKRKRIAVLPLLVPDASAAHAEAWMSATLFGLRGYDALEAFAYPEMLEVHRDALALGSDIGADFVLDASLSEADGELSVFVRLLRVADASTVWSELFSGTPHEMQSFADDTVLAVLRSLVVA